MKRALLLLALLAGCGDLADEGPLAGIGPALLDRVRGGGGQETEAAASDPRQVLTREVIEAQPVDLLLVNVPSRGATAALLRAGENGSRETWVSPDGISVTLDRGVVVATRGFGFDLMAADVSGIHAVLRGASSGTLVVETLDGVDQIVRETYTCEATEREAAPVTIFERRYSTTRVQVLCGNATRRFGSNYWVDGSGTIWKSQQFITKELGFLGIEVL